MTLGPVELVVVGFPGSRFSGEIRPRIQDLVDRNIVNIVDALLVMKDDQGKRNLTAEGRNHLSKSRAKGV